MKSARHSASEPREGWKYEGDREASADWADPAVDRVDPAVDRVDPAVDREDRSDIDSWDGRRWAERNLRMSMPPANSGYGGARPGPGAGTGTGAHNEHT
ncbi:hypothetical protein SSP35_70_00020 [Streptomyces sp. NBRC 110611]|nr:hypothetical protein SSP35_70_00020 [Streptomyces sp. NBRC 110611]